MDWEENIAWINVSSLRIVAFKEAVNIVNSVHDVSSEIDENVICTHTHCSFDNKKGTTWF